VVDSEIPDFTPLPRAWVTPKCRFYCVFFKSKNIFLFTLKKEEKKELEQE